MTDATEEDKRKILERLRDELLKEADFKTKIVKYSNMQWNESGWGMSRTPQERANLQSLAEQIETVDRALASVGVPTTTATELPAGPEWTTRLSVAAQTHLSLARKGTAASKTIAALEKTLDRFKNWIADLAKQSGDALKSVTGAPLSKLEGDPVLAAIQQQHLVAYMHHMLTNEIAGRGGIAKATARPEQVKRGLSKATVHKELGFLNGFFLEMQKAGYFPRTLRVPSKDVTPYRRGEKARSIRETKYLPFDPQELAVIFSPENLLRLEKPHEFWGPLLGLYTGARLEEICQLRLQDIRQIDGRLAIDILHGTETSTKNQPSERAIQLHDDILALGFEDYLADVNEVAPGTRLFPYLHFGSNKFGKVPSEAFRRYLKALEIKHSRNATHSLRGTLNEAFARAGVPEETRAQVLGHTQNSTNVTHYSGVMPLHEVFRSALAKVTFAPIAKNIASLRYTRGRFIPILKSEMERRRSDNENRAARKAKGLPPLRSPKNKKKA